MIKYVTGDILLSKAEAIVHGVAPNDDFKHGLALSLREQWPTMYKDFKNYCHSTHPKEGGLWSWKGAGGPVIVNLLTQEHPKQKGGTPGRASVSHVAHCLKQLVKEVEKQNISSIALTKLATGVGGLEWDDVKPVVEEHLSHLTIPVYIYEVYKDAMAAQEE